MHSYHLTPTSEPTMTPELKSLIKTQPSQYYRRAVLSAIRVEDNNLIDSWVACDIGESIEGYCLDAPDSLPSGHVRRYNEWKVFFISRNAPSAS